MNRSELVQAVAQETGVSQSQADAVLSAVVDTITQAVASGDRVQVSGLGTFERRHRAARTGRNPQTGEEMEIAATDTPGFKAAAAFKRAVGG